jgi:EAL domain-containing protein (putative c-di-GMP-specific phosphodiesterase class I)
VRSTVHSVFQPIVDLRDDAVVGYEALVRGPAGSPLEWPTELFAAARARDRVAAFDAACRASALRGAEAGGLDPAFALFINVDADTLEAELPELPAGRGTYVLEVTERALVARPEAVLRALGRLRSAGWGVALDDVSADPRALALMPIVYPDVIKVDLGRLAGRSTAEVARVVAAVGTESERRQAIVLAEGIDSEERLATARAVGATLGQGFLLGAPAPLPSTLPAAGRPLRLTSAGGDPDGPTPWQRVTNWRRPAQGPRALAERTAELVAEPAAAHGAAALVLATLPDAEAGADLRGLAGRGALVGALGPAHARGGVRGGVLDVADPLHGTWTVAALAPGYAACFVAREAEPGVYEFATSYDRELVVECALALMARMAPSA